MAEKYYEILRVHKSDFVIENEEIHINIIPTESDIIVNDDELERVRDDDSIFWVSGGGSIVIDRRYVPVIRRAPIGLNASRISLFTGRASSKDEWLTPRLLVRELFEEMLIFGEKRPLRPLVADHQDVIDSVWADLASSGLVDADTSGTIRLQSLQLPRAHVDITCEGKKYHDELCCHLNSRREVNVLFAFAADLDPMRLSIYDGEFHRVGQDVVRQNRTILLYDAKEGTARPISEPGGEVVVSSSQMTEHLQAFLSALNLAH